MQTELSEKFVEECILKHLAEKGWDYNIKTKGLHEHGCDIIVTNSRNKNKATRFLIECKGKSYVNSVTPLHPWGAISYTPFQFQINPLMATYEVGFLVSIYYNTNTPNCHPAYRPACRQAWQAGRGVEDGSSNSNRFIDDRAYVSKSVGILVLFLQIFVINKPFKIVLSVIFP